MFFSGFRQISAYFGHWVYFGLSSNPVNPLLNVLAVGFEPAGDKHFFQM